MIEPAPRPLSRIGSTHRSLRVALDRCAIGVGQDGQWLAETPWPGRVAPGDWRGRLTHHRVFTPMNGGPPMVDALLDAADDAGLIAPDGIRSIRWLFDGPPAEPSAVWAQLTGPERARMDQIAQPTVAALTDALAETLPPGATVLEVGCATGALLGALRARRPDLDLYGVDPEPAMVAHSRRAAPTARVAAGAAQAPPSALPSGWPAAWTAVISRVLAWGVVDPKSAPSTLRALTARVAPDGWLALASALPPLVHAAQIERTTGLTLTRRLATLPDGALTPLYLARRTGDPG